MTETYQARITCHNCGYQFTTDIPNSKTIHDWVLENYVCPNCNCFLRDGLDPIALELSDFGKRHNVDVVGYLIALFAYGLGVTPIFLEISWKLGTVVFILGGFLILWINKLITSRRGRTRG